MKKVPFLTLVLGLISMTAFAQTRPNILYFYVDDMGYGSIGPNGQDTRRANNLPAVQTPHIDSLAAAGINFQRAYGAPVCSPARSSQQTGYHQGHTYADRNDPDNARKAMRADDLTMGKALKAAGYVTGYWGKWGYGAESDQNNPAILNEQTLPNNHGYDYVLAELHHVRAHTFFQPTLWKYEPGDSQIQLVPNSMAAYTDPAQYPQSPANQNDPAYPSTAYCDDVYAMHCLDFVRQQAQNYNNTGTPFFALFAPQIPHAPFDEVSGLPGYADAYASDPHWSGLLTQSKQWAAMVTRIDAHIGNILAALEDPNGDGDTSDSVADNTLVIFQSDNGGPNDSADNADQYDANGGLRGHKASAYEGGIRVPLVMRWPNGIEASKVDTNSQRVVDVTDLLPTFCELSGTETPNGLDGVSIAPYITGTGTQRDREFVIHESHNGTVGFSIIRDNMKLYRASNGSEELYDLGSDMAESNNIAGSNAALVAELSGILLAEGVLNPQWQANTYHDWTGADGADISAAANWSDYVYSEGGTIYDSDSGAPRIPWTATMHNTGGSDNTAVVDAPTAFLSLEVEGSSPAARQIVDVGAETLTARNELRLKAHSAILLDTGTVDTLRWVDVLEEASLSGSGTVSGTLYQSGSLSVTQSSPIVGNEGETLTERLLNAGFESGTGTAFNATDHWSNAAGDQTRNVRNTSNPKEGSYRGIVAGSSEPSQDTGHVIQSGEVFRLSFYHAAAFNWDIGSDTIDVTVFYNDGSEQVLYQDTFNPSQEFASGYDFSGDIDIHATAGSVGHSLQIRFDSSNAADDEFASIDQVSLATLTAENTDLPGIRKIDITGDYRMNASAEVDLELAGSANAGEDYAHIEVSGNADLDGILQVTIDPAYTPSNGDTLTILTADSISGTFANPQNQVVASDGTRFTIGYTDSSVTIEAAIPTVTGEASLPANAAIANPDDDTAAGTVPVNATNTTGQSFQVNRRGALTGLLVQIDGLTSSGSVTIRLFNADGSGLPTGDAIITESAELPAGLSPGDYLQFLFSSAPWLDVGNYMFMVSTADADFALEMTGGDRYSDGTLTIESGAGWSVPNAGDDLAFALLGSFNFSAPHIIHILVDDMGYTDHSVSSLVLDSLDSAQDGDPSELSDFIRTPNIEQLASQGLSFTWCYAQPNCAPTRAAFMTGQYSPRSANGVYNVSSLNRQDGKTTYLNPASQGLSDGDEESGEDDFIAPQAIAGQPTGVVTLAQALKNSGYVTCHIGKYHVGSSNPARSTHPLNQGLDFNYGGSAYGQPGSFFALNTTPRDWHGNIGPGLEAFADDYTQEYVDAHLKPFENGNDSDSLVGTRKHLTDAVADAFEDFMTGHQNGANADQPVYVQLHFYATHAPLQGRPDLLAKYDSLKATENPSLDDKTGFAALAEHMDQSVARVLRYLDDPNLDGDNSDSIAHNTLVVWTTDNGGSEQGPHSENAPQRGAKGQHFEGGIRVPLILRMPDTIPAGAVTDTLVHSVDFYPTFLDFAEEAANTPNPNAATHPLDGESLYAHALDPLGTARNRSPIFYHFPGYMDSRAYPASVIIKEVAGERYKLIYNYDPYYSGVQDVSGSPDQYQLYNLSKDPYESVNLLDYIDIENSSDGSDPSGTREYWDYLLHAETANELAADLNAWLTQSGPTWQPLYPTYKQNFADNSPVIDNADVGSPTDPPPASISTSASVAAPPGFRYEVADFVRSDNANVELRFVSHAGFTYQVQASDSLAPDSWTNIGLPVVANGSSTELVVNDPDASGKPKRFYRIVLIE